MPGDFKERIKSVQSPGWLESVSWMEERKVQIQTEFSSIAV